MKKYLKLKPVDRIMPRIPLAAKACLLLCTNLSHTPETSSKIDYFLCIFRICKWLNLEVLVVYQQLYGIYKVSQVKFLRLMIILQSNTQIIF